MRQSALLGHPTYLSADLCFTTDSFFLLASFFFRRLIPELAERNSTKIGHMLGSNCDLKTHVQNLAYPLPQKLEAQKSPFGRLRNLMVTLIDNYKGSRTSFLNVMNFTTQTASNWTAIFTQPI